jgi:hypothetical protein
MVLNVYLVCVDVFSKKANVITGKDKRQKQHKAFEKYSMTWVFKKTE